LVFQIDYCTAGTTEELSNTRTSEEDPPEEHHQKREGRARPGGESGLAIEGKKLFEKVRRPWGLIKLDGAISEKLSRGKTGGLSAIVASPIAGGQNKSVIARVGYHWGDGTVV